MLKHRKAPHPIQRTRGKTAKAAGLLAALAVLAFVAAVLCLAVVSAMFLGAVVY
jgi:hypothetical protein